MGTLRNMTGALRREEPKRVTIIESPAVDNTDFHDDFETALRKLVAEHGCESSTEQAAALRAVADDIDAVDRYEYYNHAARRWISIERGD